MGDKKDVWQGTLTLMVLKTLEALGPLHGYGIARRIEQTSGDLLYVNYGTLYPALLKLEQEGYIASEWGVSDNNRKAKYYKLTRAGGKQLEREARDWQQTTAILAHFLEHIEITALQRLKLDDGTRHSGATKGASFRGEFGDSRVSTEHISDLRPTVWRLIFSLYSSNSHYDC